MFIKLLVFSVIAGIGATCIGGVLGILIKKPSRSYIAIMFAFAAGLMMGITFIELIPESTEYGGIVHACIGLGIGVIFVFIVSRLDSQVSTDKKNQQSYEIKEAHDLYAPAGHDHKKMLLIGMSIAIIMIMHDFPEGLVIGAASRIDSGILATIIIMLHNIPEGMIIALPLKAAGVSNWKIILFCTLGGISTMLGAFFGYAIGVTDILVAYSLAIAAGAMLCLVFVEMLPTTYEYHTNKKLQTAIIIAGTVFALVLHAII